MEAVHEGLADSRVAARADLGASRAANLDDPKLINPLVDAPRLVTWIFRVGCVPAYFVRLVLVIVEIDRPLRHGQDRDVLIVARTAIPAISWPLSFPSPRMDPGRVVEWVFDR